MRLSNEELLFVPAFSRAVICWEREKPWLPHGAAKAFVGGCTDMPGCGGQSGFAESPFILRKSLRVAGNGCGGAAAGDRNGACGGSQAEALLQGPAVQRAPHEKPGEGIACGSRIQSVNRDCGNPDNFTAMGGNRTVFPQG